MPVIPRFSVMEIVTMFLIEASEQREIPDEQGENDIKNVVDVAYSPAPRPQLRATEKKKRVNTKTVKKT